MPERQDAAAPPVRARTWGYWWPPALARTFPLLALGSLPWGEGVVSSGLGQAFFP